MTAQLVERTQAQTPAGYRWSLVGFVAFLTLALIALVDFRRGFLFADYPWRTPYSVFNPWHLLMFGAGIAGMYLCHRQLKTYEASTGNTSQYVKTLTFVILGLLVVDLFTYRGVPAARNIAAGKISVDWLQAFGATDWLKPIALATTYLLNVWHATLLGILISGLALTILPVYLKSYFTRTGFTGSLLGALFALPQPFCSCCSSVMAPSFAKRGASTNFLLSFVIGSPMLNITTLILAIALLPAPFAIARIVAGVIVAVLVTYVVARVAERWAPEDISAAGETKSPSALSEWSQRFMNFYIRLFNLDKITGDRKLDTPAQLLGAWLYASGRIALVLVPTLWLWSVIASAIFQMLPPAFGNNLPSVLLAAVGGTLFMISTWSEIPMALQLIQSGFNGPAAAMLVVLPAISLPCIMLLGGTLVRFRLVTLLTVSIMLVGIITGIIFLQ